jgi:ADP-dependent NAD(P)H-hydrate dehydratase
MNADARKNAAAAAAVSASAKASARAAGSASASVATSAPVAITRALLRDWPLPVPGGDADKEARGHVLVVAGSREMPGAALLACTAALHAGAGKLTLATAAGVAGPLGVALPEARVIALAETPAGGLQSGGSGVLAACKRACAVLIGPGMIDDEASVALANELAAACADAVVVLDAAAMKVMCAPRPARFPGPVLLTPHAGEMAGLTGVDKDQVSDHAADIATDAARRWQVAVALKGATTLIAMPDGRLWRHQGGNAGLGVSGSGDVLAGLIAGLVARGTPVEQAAAWGVALHARAGEQLALKTGPLGYLARELSAQVPALMSTLSAP